MFFSKWDPLITHLSPQLHKCVKKRFIHQKLNWTASVKKWKTDKINKSHWSNLSHKVSFWTTMYCSHSNWHPAAPEGKEKRIHDSYPNNNSLRIQIYWGKLPPPDSQADSCEEEGPSRKQINKNNHSHPLFANSWSLFSVCLLWSRPCWLVLTNRKMVKSNNFFMPAGWNKVRLAALLVSQLLWIRTKAFLNSPVKKVDKWKGHNDELCISQR